jgi:hypothetical protein
MLVKLIISLSFATQIAAHYFLLGKLLQYSTTTFGMPREGVQQTLRKVDEDRLYFLELIVRNRLRESLTEDEFNNDLEKFKAEEETRVEPKAERARQI